MPSNFAFLQSNPSNCFGVRSEVARGWRVRPHVGSYGRTTLTKSSRWYCTQAKPRQSRKAKPWKYQVTCLPPSLFKVLDTKKNSILRGSCYSSLKEGSFKLIMRSTMTIRLSKSNWGKFHRYCWEIMHARQVQCKDVRLADGLATSDTRFGWECDVPGWAV